MRNEEIARYFEDLSDLLEIKGANHFRVRAYRNAARTIQSLSESITEIVNDSSRSLQELSGIGKDLAEKIVKIVETSELEQLNELRAEIPAEVVAMLKIPGLGPKKVALLFNKLSLTSFAELEQAAQAGDIATLKGFGKKTEQSILAGLEHLSEVGKRTRIDEAKVQADQLLADLLNLKSVQQGAVAGSCRRRKETVGDLDLLVTATDSEEVMQALADHQMVREVLAQGETKQRVRLQNGLEMDLRVVPEESYGAALQYFTGSKEHNIVMRRKAIERGYKLNEYGLMQDEKIVAGRTEAEIYQKLDLSWIPPELREDRGEFELAEQDSLPKLVEVVDIRGDLHMHTTATDGTASILEMANAAKERGLEYIAITDHSKRVTMANGLDGDRLRKHWEEIEKVQAQVSGVSILKGVECDILEDASLDLPDEVLKEADFVIAVLHYGLKQPREQINQRLLTAIRSPYVSAIGHLTGRIVAGRPGADVGVEEIFQAAAEHGVMLEINAHPSRLDLNDLHAKAACREYGIPILINTDAHSIHGFDVLPFGIFQARRAGLEKKDIANTRSLAEFKKLIRKN